MSEAEAGVAPIPAPGDGAEELGGAAPGPQSRETPGGARRGDERHAAGEGGGESFMHIDGFGEATAKPGGWVFVDFGRSKVYALTNDGDEVLIFNNLVEMVERLKPAVVVLDSLPGKLQNTATELVRRGITFLKLKNLKRLSEERSNNGITKSDGNDVRLLRQLYYRRPDDFQPLCTSSEELTVRALTELWVQIAFMKKVSAYARTITNNNNPVVVEINKSLRNSIDKLSKEIHEQALKIPLYKRGVEELGLKGPTLAYIVSHDAYSFMTLSKDRLAIRYALTHHHRHRRPFRSTLLIMLARATTLKKHPRYSRIYEHYRNKGKKHWQAILRVAQIILRDLRKLAKNGQQAQKAVPPA